MLKAVVIQFQWPACLRSEGPSVNSPVRKGGMDAAVSYLSAEGATRLVAALRASALSRDENPRPYGRGY